jgi:hypothetical protein
MTTSDLLLFEPLQLRPQRPPHAHFASDLFEHFVEGASKDWDTSTAPWHKVALVSYPAQGAFQDAGGVRSDGFTADWLSESIKRSRSRLYAIGRGQRAEGRGQRAERNQMDVKFPKNADDARTRSICGRVIVMANGASNDQYIL